MKYKLDVYLLESTLAFDRLYSYLADTASLPEGCGFRRGMFVCVPFGQGNKKHEALVWNVSAWDNGGNAAPAVAAGSNAPRPVRLKEINAVLDDEPLTEAEADLCASIRDAYACTLGTVVHCVRPLRGSRGTRREVEVAELAVSRETARELIAQTRLRSIYQLRLLEALSETEREDSEKLLFRADANRVHLKALEKKGLVRLTTREAGAEDVAPGTEERAAMLSTYPEHQLNAEQQEAFERVREDVDHRRGGVFLLKGVTGSGKTEVYMHLISHVLAKGGYVIVLVPEIALTPQMIAHFTGRFGPDVALWHSGLSDAVREREWYRMKKGIAHVAVCTRSGIFAPFRHTDLVIIDEAHDGSYRSEDSGLRYDTGEVAELRFAGQATVLYGSATPDVTMYYRAVEGEIGLLTLNRRAGPGTLPEITVADMREERAALAQGGFFSRALMQALADNYASGGQAMLFVGRRGYSSRLYCRSCGRTMICGSCGLAMTFHAKAKRLLCNYCGKAAPSPANCPACGSGELGFGSPGTERVERELKRLFPDAEVLRMDSDTVKGRDGHAAILKKFQKEHIPFLVGTQMITKGHDFPGVTLVGIVDADGQLNQPEYYADEKAFQIITQVAGRAGRGDRPGKVIIQTYNVDSASLKAAVNGDYEAFCRGELAFRRAMLYPPFCTLMSVRVSGEDDRGVYDYLAALAAALRTDIPEGSGMQILGPSREPVPKINGRYRWRLTVKAQHRAQIIQHFFDKYGKIKQAAGIRLALIFEGRNS